MFVLQAGMERSFRERELASRLLVALVQALRAVRKHRPSVVLGAGGFVSGPGGLAAWLLRRPLVVHEQNAVAGLTNRVLARLADRVLAVELAAAVDAQGAGGGGLVARAVAEALERKRRLGQYRKSLG